MISFNNDYDISNIMFMKSAISNANIALKINEVPVGCVIVHSNKIIAHGFNKRNLKQNVLYHAEMIAINSACEKLKSWRLEETVLYVTIEPCVMCAGAILQARVPKVVFGAKNPKAGCAGSIINIFNNNKFNHTVEVVSGVMESECSNLIQYFFKKLRN
jgi:tRNA(adenine34) deaminase